MSIEELKKLDLTKITLGSDAGRNRFLEVSENVISRIKSQANVLRSITVYIDPAPTATDRSLNAMAFVTKILEKNGLFNYVLLWVEEFRTCDIENANKCIYTALSMVFMQALNTLHSLYEGYFTNYISIPESNMISMDRFWVICQELLIKDTRFSTILNSDITIHTKITINRKRKMVHKQISPPKRYQMKDEIITQALQRGSNRLFSTVHDTNDMQTFRIGYTLGSDKITRCLHFYSTCYNYSENNSQMLTRAAHLSSHTMVNNVKMLTNYIANQMDTQHLHRNSRKYLTVSGKGKNPDDLSTCIIFAVSLYDETINDFNSLLRLSRNSI